MPAIYMSFAFAPDDTTEQRMSKLYLGIISVGEQLYTYNAAIAEMRKTAATLQSGREAFDKDLARMKKQYDELKAMLKAEKEAGQLPDERFMVKPPAEWNV